MDGGGSVGAPVIPGFTGLVELGRSPAALTFRGVDASGRTVVIKVLQRDATPEVRARFDYDQTRLVELLEHPDIVNTIAHGYTDANQPFVVMEELGGGSMAARVGSGMDGPGVLARITAVVAEAGANIDEVHHQRAFSTLSAQSVEVELVLQTRNPAHVTTVVGALKAAGFDASAY